MEESDPRWNEWAGSLSLFDFGGQLGWDTNASFQQAAANPNVWAGWLAGSSYNPDTDISTCTYNNINGSFASVTTDFAGQVCPDGFIFNLGG